MRVQALGPHQQAIGVLIREDNTAKEGESRLNGTHPDLTTFGDRFPERILTYECHEDHRKREHIRMRIRYPRTGTDFRLLNVPGVPEMSRR